MDNNNILPVVLAGGKSKRFGENKSQAQLGGKILIDYILSEIVNEFKEVLIVANENIEHLPSEKIIKIEGGIKLSGEITPQGAKNEALQVICATLLTKDEVVIDNIPNIIERIATSNVNNADSNK